jgi:fumarylpyruvate hydrolase
MSHLRYSQSWESLRPSMRNIFCVGRNYRDHASELGNSVPTEPMIFGKFTHALAPAQGVVQFQTVSSEEIHYELEIILYLDRQVTETSSPGEVVGAIALGLDLTDRVTQSSLKKKGYPWELAKSFVGSAIISDFYTFDTFADVENSTFELEINGKKVQEGHPRDMVFNFETLIQYCHRHFGLTHGDLLFTGTPAGVGPLVPGDNVAMILNGTRIAEFSVGK